MCGRFTLTVEDPRDVAAAFGVEPEPELLAAYRPRYNIAPTDGHWMLRVGDDRRRLVPARWGLGDRRQINVRGETAPTRNRTAFASRRCVIPADGFFEWDERKRPHWFHSPGNLVLFAGLYDVYRDGSSAFAILTTSASELIAPIHDRMPAVLLPDEVTPWLEAEEAPLLAALLKPTPTGVLIDTPVSRRVSSVANDDPACLEPPGPEDDKGQLPLL